MVIESAMDLGRRKSGNLNKTNTIVRREIKTNIILRGEIKQLHTKTGIKQHQPKNHKEENSNRT
jgi:hypothetical protein